MSRCAKHTFMNSVLSRLFQPLARLAIAKGMRFGDVAEQLKRAYVGVARDLAEPKASVSRISVMTGLQRRDVSRLLENAGQPGQTRPNALSRLVALWLARFDGAPLPHHGAEGSFDALARSIRRDVHPKSLLQELIAAGTAEVDSDVVRLLKAAHVPLKGSEAQIEYLGKNVGDHFAVAVGNVLQDPPAFELAVHYDGLSIEAVQELEALWRKRVEPILHEVSARALALQQQESGPARFRGGGYFRVEVKE